MVPPEFGKTALKALNAGTRQPFRAPLGESNTQAVQGIFTRHPLSYEQNAYHIPVKAFKALQIYDTISKRICQEKNNGALQKI